nr:unnamed protein product [Spirometra erinaceieuropaei]
MSMTTRVINLSKRILSPAEISLLSKGIGFNHTDALPTNFLAGLESVLLASALPEDRRADIRSCATGILRQKRRQQTLPADEAQGLRSLRSDHNIVVVPADKGGATVFMDRIDYVNKANGIFGDVASYTLLAEDPTEKQGAAIKKKVNELTRLKVISPDDSKLMTLSDPHIARAYGLPKVHKVDAPVRIIVPLIGSPTYNIAKWLYKHLKQLTHGSDYNINNSLAFLQRIQGLEVSADECLLSFDVVALFSSIPHDLAIDCVAQRLQENPIEIPTQHIIELLKLCLRNYCQFDNKFYQQVKGTPMGSPISGLIAEIVLQRLEKKVFQDLSPKVWLRYVDDTFVVIKNCEVERLHQRLNDVFPAIQFTREEAIGDSLPFLDVKIQRLSDGRSLDTRINEHKLAVRRRDPLSLVFAHALECDHRFNWDGTEVVAMANTKRAREFLEAWYSDAGSINRHVDLDAHYEGLRSRLTAPRPDATATAANLATRSPIDPPLHPPPPAQASIIVPPPPSLRDLP